MEEGGGVGGGISGFPFQDFSLLSSAGEGSLVVSYKGWGGGEGGGGGIVIPLQM